MPTPSFNIAQDAAATFAAYTWVAVNKVDGGVERTEAESATYPTGVWANGHDEALIQCNEVFQGTRFIDALAIGSGTAAAGNLFLASGGKILAAGATTTDVSTDYDDVVIGPASGSVGVSLKPGAGNTAGIAVVDGAVAEQGAIYYHTTNNRWAVKVENADELYIDNAAITPAASGGLSCGTASLPWSDVRAQAATITGDVAIGTAAGGARLLAIDAAAANEAQLYFRQAGFDSWIFTRLGTSKDLQIKRRNDTGGAVDTPFEISYSTGSVTLPNALSVGGNLTLSGTSSPKITVGGATATGSEIDIDADIGSDATLGFLQEGAASWYLSRIATSKNFSIRRRNDSGGAVDTPFEIAYTDAAITLSAGTGGASAAGGVVTVSGGPGGSTSGAGGAVTLQGGTATDGAGGACTVAGRAGVGTNQAGGILTVRGGDATGTGTGGNANIQAGNSPSGTMGIVQILTAGGTYTAFSADANTSPPAGARIGFFGVTPVKRAAAYTPTNVTTDRSYDADTVAVAELADIVGTLIADLQAYGLLQ